jgi:uncharacterized Fe-S center protein
MNERQFCDECGNDTQIEAMRYFRMDTHLCNFCVHRMLDNYRKLLQFIKEVAEINISEKELDNIRWNFGDKGKYQVFNIKEARELLREIGELS